MKKTLFTAALLSLSFTATSQTFSIPLAGFSKKKTTYLHMEDGSKSEGLLGGFKRTKGQIETIKMKNDGGKKIKVDPATIKFMYVPPSNLAKIGSTVELAKNARRWDTSEGMDTVLLEGGYVYLEKVNTQIKKKKVEDLMLQLLNAPFSSKIKVFYDPMAKETAGLSVGGVTVAGGLDKSYFVIKAGSTEPAYKLEKKDYKEQFATLFGDCDEFMTEYGDDIKWSNLETHIYQYTQMCE